VPSPEAPAASRLILSDTHGAVAKADGLALAAATGADDKLLGAGAGSTRGVTGELIHGVLSARAFIFGA